MVARHREQFSILQKRGKVSRRAIIIILFTAYNRNRQGPAGNLGRWGVNERIQDIPQRHRITACGFQERLRHPCGRSLFMLPQIVKDVAEMRPTISGLGQAFQPHA